MLEDGQLLREARIGMAYALKTVRLDLPAATRHSQRSPTNNEALVGGVRWLVDQVDPGDQGWRQLDTDKSCTLRVCYTHALF